MKLLVLGASGGVGKHLVRLACDQGHSVTALVRRADGIDPLARILIDDVLRPACFNDHASGHEVVLSALGTKRTNPANPWGALASPPDFSSRTAAMLVNAIRQHGLARVIAVSAAGVADSAARMNLLMKFLVAKSNSAGDWACHVHVCASGLCSNFCFALYREFVFPGDRWVADLAHWPDLVWHSQCPPTGVETLGNGYRWPLAS